MDNMNELNLNEMESVTGGAGGYSKKPVEKKGFFIYQIVAGDNLTRIAKRFGTTVKAIKDANPTITDVNFIRSGYYIYIPEKG